MFLWTHFTKHFAEHKHRMPKRIRDRIRKEAIERVREAWKEGSVATKPMYFDDLIAEIEKAVQPK